MVWQILIDFSDRFYHFHAAFSEKACLFTVFIKLSIMKKVSVLLFALFVSLSLISAQENSRETRKHSNFSKVSFGISGDLRINLGNSFSVELEGSPDDIDAIITEVSGDRLIIKHENWRFNIRDKVNINITMPAIEGLSVSGSGRAEISDDLANADELSLGVSGSGNIHTGSIEVDEFEATISGSGNIFIEGGGLADRGDISISGSGGYEGSEFEIDNLTISVSGSGNCLCKAGDALKASISGSGNVSYKGEPRIEARVSGSGKVRSAK